MSVFSFLKLLEPVRQGKVKQLNGQYIETTFILFIPIRSYFIVEKPYKEVKIPMNKTSLKAFFIPFIYILSAFLFAAMMIIVSNHYHWNPTNTVIEFLPITISGSLIIWGFYLKFRKEKLDTFEVKKREAIQKAINLNFLPEWLDESSKQKVLNTLNLPDNWLRNIEQNNLSNFEVYFTAIYFTYSLNPSIKNKLLYEKLEKKL